MNEKEANICIRREKEDDYRYVEEMTRSAFWNRYRPGCSEHFVLHQFRGRPEIVSELDLVLEVDYRIVAHIMYTYALIHGDDESILPVLTFGPVSVMPEYQKQGYGERLIRYSMKQAYLMGAGGIAITGDPNYYQKFGFESAQDRGIYYPGIPREEKTPFFMVVDLIPGYFDCKVGTYEEPEGYHVDEEALQQFDQSFPPLVPQVLPGQLS